MMKSCERSVINKLTVYFALNTQTSVNMIDKIAVVCLQFSWR